VDYESASHSTEPIACSDSYDDSNPSVAPEVALNTLDNGWVELKLPDDLSGLILLWPKQHEAMKSALLALVRANVVAS
jgi:hypothetical protein